MTFETLANQLHNERISNLVNRHKERVLLGEDIYTNFCVWCNGFATKNDKTNPNAFGYFLKQEKITLNDTQRRHLLSKYFGYKVKYNNETKQWEISKQ
jgi:hypothetical protein